MFQKTNIYRYLVAITFTLFAQTNAITAEAANPQELNCDIATATDIHFIKDSNTPANSILHIKINHYCAEATGDIGIKLREFFAKNPEDFSGIILDLRDTKSGLAHHIAGIASIFLASDQLVAYLQDQKGAGFAVRTGSRFYQAAGITEDFLRDIPATLKTKPLIAIVNTDTDNAAEFIASGLLRNNRAVLIGEEFINGVSNNLIVGDAFYAEALKLFPVVTVTAPDKPKRMKHYLRTELIPKGCSQAETNIWRNLIQSIISRHVSYPKLARMRGWEGEGMVIATVSPKGKLVDAKVEVSTGIEKLDDAMLNAVKTAQLKALDCAKEDTSLKIGAPFVFKLEPAEPENTSEGK